MLIVEHTPTRLIVGSSSQGPRAWGVLFLLVGGAVLLFTTPRTPISLSVGAVFVLSGLAGIRRPYDVTARFDRVPSDGSGFPLANVTGVRVVHIAGHDEVPLGDVTGLRLIHMSGADERDRDDRGIPLLVEYRGGVSLLGFVRSREDPALGVIRQFLGLPRVEETDLGHVDGVRRLLVWTALTWGISPTLLIPLFTRRSPSIDTDRPFARCAYCPAQSREDRVFCHRCGGHLVRPDLGVRPSFGRRAVAGVIDPLIGTTVVALASYAGTPMPGGGKSIDGLAAWGLLVTLGGWLWLWRGGSSPGKLLLGLRVVCRRSARRPGILRMTGRETLGKTLSGLPLGLGFFVAASEPDCRTLHDRLFGTVVVARRPIAPELDVPAHDMCRNSHSR